MSNDFDDELRHHVESLEEEYRARGLTAEDARAAAHRDLGGVLRTQELYREQRGWGRLEALWRDLRLGFRSLRRTPALAAAIIGTLALGIGANTAIFGVVQAVQLRPLPFRDADRLMWITGYRGPLTAQSFERLTFYGSNEVPVEDGANALMLRAAFTSHPVTELLGVRPALGRDFVEEELARPGVLAAQGVMLISNRLFVEQYSGDPQVVGHTVRLFGRIFTITGVLPPDFRLPLPRGPQAQEEPDLIISEYTEGQMIGRLRAGFTPQAAETELRILQTGPTGVKTRVMPLHEYVVGNTRREMLVLWAAVGCVLLIACVNVTNLLLARSVSRTRETSVRAALGAGRWSLLQAALAETSLLSVGGGLLGTGMAWVVLQYVARLRDVGLPRLPDVTLDGSVLLYAAGCCVLTALLAGTGPMFSVLRAGLQTALRRGEGNSSQSAGFRTFHGGLAVTQVALAMVLLAAAGLLIKSLYLSRSAAAEADARHVLVSRLTRGFIREVTTGALAGLYDDRNREIHRQLGLLPGVLSASLYVDGTFGMRTSIDPFPEPGSHPQVGGAIVGEQYFAASGYRLIAGRLFNASDTRGPRGPAASLVVNQTFVRMFAPALREPGEVLGRRVFETVQGTPRPVGTIIGVVNDLVLRKQAGVDPQMFRALAQSPPGMGQSVGGLVLRASGDPIALSAKVRQILEPHGMRLLGPETLEDRVSAAVATRQFESATLAAFAAIALLLSTVGIYGVLSYSVAQRTREIGIRIALGGEPWDVMKMVLGRGTRLTTLGIVLGLAGALALTRMMGAMIYGVAPNDPWVLGAVCAALLVIAMLAAYVPARRATRVNPVEALRHE